MFKKEDKNWKQFQDLTKIMESVPQKHAPDNFTSRLMVRISEEKETAQSFSLQRLFPTSLNFGFGNAVTKTECAFYFLLTGFFYFILGLIMMIGLPLPVVVQNNGWLSFQPLFGILLAVELIIIGTILYKRGDSAVRFVRMGTLLYAVLIILNFVIGALLIQPAAVFIIAIFSLTGLALAVLLRIAVDHYHPETVFSEVGR
ncbi:MAG: hypothetical protein JW976_03950 [Syntrophaceae bacterium]|nr:hypothetical protein [Syntrophaceae bacterium]